MSRIHEALRKAEQERAEHSTAGVHSIAATTPAAIPDERPAALAVGISSPIAAPMTIPEAPRFEALKQKCAKPEWNLKAKISLFDNGRTSVAAEQFRTLRSRLYRLREKHPCQTVLVTSSLPAEGKTFVAANLAQAIVQQHERRALLIDADLRAPRLHVEIGAPSSPGLTEYLQGEVDEFAVMQSSPDGNLFFIPGGKTAPNPTELLASGRLKILLDRIGSLVRLGNCSTRLPCFPWPTPDCSATFATVCCSLSSLGRLPMTWREKHARNSAGRTLSARLESGRGNQAILFVLLPLLRRRKGLEASRRRILNVLAAAKVCVVIRDSATRLQYFFRFLLSFVTPQAELS